jgi:integrase/recombinase XerD
MLIVMILGTGIRRGEIIGLKWTDIDFENLAVSVFGKSRRKESIPMTMKLTKELRAYQAFCRQHWGSVGEYVFTKRDYSQLTEHSIMQVFQYLKDKMNFTDVRVSPHTFRHTFCHKTCYVWYECICYSEVNEGSKYNCNDEVCSYVGE